MLRPQLLLPLLLLLDWGNYAQASEQRMKRAAPYTAGKKWDTSEPISFVLDPGYNDHEKSVIRKVLHSFHDRSCFRFEENGPGDKLEFVHSPGDEDCRADLGKKNNVTKIYIASHCIDDDTIYHEILHSLGFEHTQVRTDRDDYIKVDLDNVKDEWKYEYTKLDSSQSSTNYGIPYEFNSVMHYNQEMLNRARSAIDPNKPIVELVDPYYSTTMGREHGMLFNDWKMVNMHYQCNAKCGQNECQNGGYQHPNNCDECICPLFYNGTRCELEKNPYTLRMGEVKHLDYGWPFDKEAYAHIPEYPDWPRSPARVIKSPVGSQIRITINNIDDRAIKQNGCPPKCKFQALEIVDGDLTRVGKRFCCFENLPYSFVSSGNIIGYRVYARPGLDFVTNITVTVDGSTPETPIDPQPEPTPATPESKEMGTVTVEGVTVEIGSKPLADPPASWATATLAVIKVPEGCSFVLMRHGYKDVTWPSDGRATDVTLKSGMSNVYVKCSPDAETVKPDVHHTTTPTTAAQAQTTLPPQGNDRDQTTPASHQDTMTTEANPTEQPNVDPQPQTTLPPQVIEQTTPGPQPEPPVTDAPPAPVTTQPNPVEPTNASVPDGAKEVGTVIVGGISTVITEGPSLKERGEVPAAWADTKEAQFSIQGKCTMIVNFIKKADGVDYPSNHTIQNKRNTLYNIPFTDIQAIENVRGSCK